jgi:serine/threonine protein phosphatase PrpC
VSQSRILQLSSEHRETNDSEADRILSMGGYFAKGRVSGRLEVTRSLGDYNMKTQGVIGRPDIMRYELNQGDRFLVIASDGIWDVLDP